MVKRPCNVLLVSAMGDALGVPYESLPPTTDGRLVMSGGGLGNFAPGGYSDDTSMAVAIALAAADHDLRTEIGVRAVAEQFLSWLDSDPGDVGIQTRHVLHLARRRSDPRTGMRDAAAGWTERNRNGSAGNGALMRTAILGVLPYGRDEVAAVTADVAALTHPDSDAVASCVLWTEAVRLAWTEDRLDILSGLDLLEPGERDRWAGIIRDAQTAPPVGGYGWTVRCLQAAWWAATSTPDTTGALEHAVRLGGDTDTVAATVGGLLGALPRDVGGLPPGWFAVHGWPGLDAAGLVGLADRVARGPVPVITELEPDAAPVARRKWWPPW